MVFLALIDASLSSEFDEIPCIFPANREFETETSSLVTAHSSGESGELRS